MDKKLLIFDLDGTLVDSGADLATGINLMRAHYQLFPLDVGKVKGFIGNGAKKLVARSMQDADVDLDEAFKIYRKSYTEHILDETRLYPGAEDGLKILSENNALAVLSNKPGVSTRKIIYSLCGKDLFLEVLGGGDLPNLKPAPDGVDALVEKSGVSKENTWMIGDHNTDLEVAKNAGVNSGFVTYGIGHPGDFSTDKVWNSFPDIVDFFSS